MEEFFHVEPTYPSLDKKSLSLEYVSNDLRSVEDVYQTFNHEHFGW